CTHRRHLLLKLLSKLQMIEMGECLSTKYKNCDTNLLWHCSVTPHTLEEAKQMHIVRMANVFLLNIKTVMLNYYGGHKWYASFNKVNKHNTWCQYCSDAKMGHKTDEMPEGSKIPKKVISLGELVQRKFTEISKKLKKPKLSSHNSFSTFGWKDLWNFLRNNWKQVMGISMLRDFVVAFVVDRVSEYRVISALENGTKPVPKPDKDHSYYHVICGEHGTGKTTLARMEAKNVGRGVIYVDVPPDFEDLGKSFGKAINMFFLEDISIISLLVRKFFLTGSESAISSYQWRRVKEVFRRISEEYQEKHKKPTVIIYDNVSQLIPENSKVLDILQDEAKRSADEGTYVAVFVTNEGSVLHRMESHSSWSRAKQPVVEVGDLSEEESMKYLIEKRKIAEVDARKIYELVGGRVVELKSVADDFLFGQSFKVIKQTILNETEKKFQSAQLLPGDKYYEIGKNIIRDLLSSKELRFLEFKKFFSNGEGLNEVLKSNIFAYHPSKNTVTFRSQSVECYVREK
ncbi:5112_t:CDS:2, partial [Gigaspora margarita]